MGCWLRLWQGFEKNLKERSEQRVVPGTARSNFQH